MSETFNAADRKSIRRREKEAAKWKNEARNVVVDLMSSPYGRRWIWEKIATANVFQVNPDKDTVLFTEGQRSIGNALMAEVIDACPEQFILAMRESNARSSSANAPEPGSHANAADTDDADSESIFEPAAPDPAS